MGWIHAGNSENKLSLDENSVRARQEALHRDDCRRKESSPPAQKRVVPSKEDWAALLQRNEETSRKGDLYHEPKWDPSDPEINSLVDWFKKNDLLVRLQELLVVAGWDQLTDQWELREALLLAQTHLHASL